MTNLRPPAHSARSRGLPPAGPRTGVGVPLRQLCTASPTLYPKPRFSTRLYVQRVQSCETGTESIWLADRSYNPCRVPARITSVGRPAREALAVHGRVVDSPLRPPALPACRRLCRPACPPPPPPYAACAGTSVPQYLHLVAASGRSSDRHAGQAFTGAGVPNTVTPRRAEMWRYGSTMAKYTTTMKMTK